MPFYKQKGKNMSKIHCIHDKTFKSAMADVRVARDFFEHHLPKPIQALMDLKALKLSPNSYVDEQLNALSSDVLYQVKMSENDGVGYLYLLCEHQSSIDPLMPYRLWSYIVRIWGDYLKQTGSKKLPFVFPLVFYHGKEPYTGPRSLCELIQAPSSIVEDALFKSFHLVDTHDIKDEELRTQHWAGILAFMFKHVFDRDIWPMVQTVIEMLRKLEKEEGAAPYAHNLLKYWLISAETQKGPKAFIEAVQQGLSLPIEGELMSMAEQLIQQGLQQGIQQGIQQGEAHLLISLLKAKFKGVPEIYLNKIESADANSLNQWAINVINSQSLDEVFNN
jgi:predicted transposase/invertase (TIGR01784 family)